MAGTIFPEEWLSRHINEKDMYALFHLLLQFCQVYLDTLRQAQVLMDGDNESVVGACNRAGAVESG